MKCLNKAGLSIRQWALTATLLTLSIPAQAGIIRGPGGTVQQDSFNETVMLYDEATLDYRASRVVSGTSIGSYSRNSLHFPVYATPPADCWNNVFIDPESSQLRRTECHYEFYLGDMLELLGVAALPISGADYLLTWHIEGGGRSWDFSGDALGLAQLLTAMPDDMGPGEYNATLTFRQLAPDGFTLFRYSNILDPYRCDETDNQEGTGPEIVCGQIGYLTDEVSWTDATRIVIRDRPVPTPASLALLLTGAFGWLLLRRRAG